jgi:hypothetical protein
VHHANCFSLVELTGSYAVIRVSVCTVLELIIYLKIMMVGIITRITVFCPRSCNRAVSYSYLPNKESPLCNRDVLRSRHSLETDYREGSRGLHPSFQANSKTTLSTGLWPVCSRLKLQIHNHSSTRHQVTHTAETEAICD